ncbi:hypothetical protein TNCV_4020091 [Trichonephila clavipes]|nr:hypothetical protein TNCV_4020091 [Trichonephila clavipes]
MGRTILLERRQSESVGRKVAPLFLRSDWPRPFARRERRADQPGDTPRPGRPKTTRTPENIERVEQLEENDRHLTKRMIAEELGITTESVHLVLNGNLEKRKLCRRPHRLTPEQSELAETSLTCQMETEISYTTSSQVMRVGV